MVPSRRIDLLPEQADIMWYLSMKVPEKIQKELKLILYEDYFSTGSGWNTCFD
jgi:hypothetical protein